MDYATSYQQCTQPDQATGDLPMPTELEMMTYYISEIGVLIGGMIHTQDERKLLGLEPDPMIPYYQRTLRRIRDGLTRERDSLRETLESADAV